MNIAGGLGPPMRLNSNRSSRVRATLRATPSRIHPLLAITLAELFVGGGGRILELGPVTVRMVLFATCVLAMLWMAATKPTPFHSPAPPLAAIMLAAYLAIHGLAFLTGVIAGNDTGSMITELQQSAYWLIGPFFAYSLTARAPVKDVVALVKACSMGLAIAYLLLLTALLTNIVDVAQVYELIRDSSEFALRNDSLFFYKGFLYLGIGLIFFVATAKERWVLYALICAAALLLALTRGFVLATSIALLLMLFQQRRWRALAVSLAGVAAAAIFIWGYLPESDDAIGDQREISNEQRLGDMAEIVKFTTVKTVLLGEGAGTPVRERVLVENTYLWAFWHMGLPGVAFWLAPLAISCYYFLRIRRRDTDYAAACAFFYGTVLVYVQTAANPYLNNPIGLSFVMISMFSLATFSTTTARTLARSDRS